MRALYSAPLLLLIGLFAQPLPAAERGVVIRATNLMEKPFIDAAPSGSVAANEAVSILVRQGAWAQVEAGGKSGWVRVLNLRMGPAVPVQGKTNASLLTTGSSGRTVTTGIKGLDEEKVRNASPDPVELEKLNALGTTTPDAQALAASDKLAENKVNYLKKGKVK